MVGFDEERCEVVPSELRVHCLCSVTISSARTPSERPLEHLPCMVPPACQGQTRAGPQLYVSPQNAYPCVVPSISARGPLLRVACVPARSGPTRYIAAAVTRTQACSTPAQSAQITSPVAQRGHAYARLLHHRLVLQAPRQALLRPPVPQTLLDLMALHKDIHIHQVLDPLLPCQRPRTLPVPAPQQIIDQQSVQPHSRPLVVLDVRQTRDLVQILQVPDPLPRVPLYGLLFLVQAFQFPLQALHPADHAVEGGEGRDGSLAGQGGVGGRFERREDACLLHFDVPSSDFEVFASKFVRETEKRLILCSVSREKRSPGQGVSKEELTRSRWLSALSLVVVSSAMFSAPGSCIFLK